MRFPLALAALLSLGAALAEAGVARADVLSTCDAYDALITCASADVGKPCQGGGRCYAITCGSGASTSTQTVYKCDTCPAILPAPDAGCQPSSFGTACGDGGSCSSIQPYCSATAKYVCAGAVGPRPTGPPTGEAADGSVPDGGACVCGSKGGGCDVASSGTFPGALALGLLVLGAAALLFDRARRRRRRV